MEEFGRKVYVRNSKDDKNDHDSEVDSIRWMRTSNCTVDIVKNVLNQKIFWKKCLYRKEQSIRYHSNVNSVKKLNQQMDW